MSFYCKASKCIVENESQVLVPVKVRKVVYTYYTKPDTKSNFLQFKNQGVGWEVVESHAVCRRLAEEYEQQNTPVKVVQEKEVKIILPTPKKVKKYKKNTKIRQLDNDKDVENF